MSVDRDAEPTAKPHWRKSSHSAGDGGECVEVARTPGAVLIRDSKTAEGPRLTVGRKPWTEFLRFALGG